MKLGFLVNDVATEKPRFTSTLLAHAALRRGHETWTFGVEDFLLDDEDSLHVRARRAPEKEYESPEAYIEALQSDSASAEWRECTELDVLLLRNDPAEDQGKRSWAMEVNLIFGREAARRGVMVLNDPDGLSRATNKLYLNHFPREVRPRTLLARDRERIREFAARQPEQIILKPLQGSGGQGVFLVRTDEDKNLNQMIESVSRDGYVLAQEYLPAAEEGDVRLFLVNGRPLQVDGRYAMIRRRQAEGDVRSNMHQGGTAEKAEMNDAVQRIAQLVEPRLRKDGMFFVGLDIAEDKLMEINVFSPGGLYSASDLHGVDFAAAVVAALEHKVVFREKDPEGLPNIDLATL